MPKALRVGDCVHEQHPCAPTPPAVIWTIGHSDRSLETFVHLLQIHGVTLVVDVRKMPRSRHNPQFNRDTFPQALRDVGIDYVDMPGLGGMRRPRPDSPNTGWKNASFQGYADYMLTPDFEQSLQYLLERVGKQSAVLMCAEAVPWRCHRSLIADALVVRDIGVEHILSATRTQPHVLRPWAQVHGTRITYPPQTEEQGRSVRSDLATAPGVEAPNVTTPPQHAWGEPDRGSGEVFTGDHTNDTRLQSRGSS